VKARPPKTRKESGQGRFYKESDRKYTALSDVMRYKNPTPNPLPASDEGAMMYLIIKE
jgi:hypothetical protein